MPRLLLALVLSCLLAGCSRPAPQAAVSAQSRDADEHEAGRRVYNFRCYFCHGYSGDARTLAASMVEPAPRDFTRAHGLDERRVLAALREGIPGTAMASFAGTLSPREMEQVAHFVVAEFVTARAPNTRYHTAANGWPDHQQRYAPAFPFATGEIALDREERTLSDGERAGRRLYMSACISCHDRARVRVAGPAFASGGAAAAQTGTAIYRRHCAACHGEKGDGRSLAREALAAQPRDFTAKDARKELTREYMIAIVRDGRPHKPMVGRATRLSQEEIEAVVDYIRATFMPP